MESADFYVQSRFTLLEYPENCLLSVIKAKEFRAARDETVILREISGYDGGLVARVWGEGN
jgi:hypothetical protein